MVNIEMVVIMNRIERDVASILATVKRIESTLNSGSHAASSETDVLRERLMHLTIKRHAVLTATLGGVSYSAIARMMQCDETTVKLHLKAAMTALGVQNRSLLLVSHKAMLDEIPDKEYASRYGLSKTWWLEQKPDLMDVLKASKGTSNQHTKGVVP